MSIGRFSITVIGIFILFGVLHAIAQLLFTDTYTRLMTAMLPVAGQNMALAMTGHLLQTIIIVLLFDKGVATNDIKKGAFFGACIGLLLASSNMVFFSGTVIPPDILLVHMPIEIMIATIAGAALAKFYKKT